MVKLPDTQTPMPPNDEPTPPRRGLSSVEAAQRLRRDGPNLLPQQDRRNWIVIVWGVLREPMLLLLLAAAGVYLLLGDPQEAAVLAASVLLVIAVTVYQEQKSEHALQALRDLSSPRARVWRDGQVITVAAREVVVGDLIAVSEGDRVPADARVHEDADLHVDESMLTGESAPVRRSALATDEEEQLLRASTLVVRGRGLAEVIATGTHTAVGQIGAALHAIRPERTPIQREMRHVVALFALVGLASCIAVVALYVTTRGGWLDGLLAGITLAISNIPEEFPVVLTVFLALGAWRMARHQALVRRAPAIEALGAITALCTDKTGTLTENRMAVAELSNGEQQSQAAQSLPPALRHLLDVADLASQALPTDPMDRAIRSAAEALQDPLPREGWRRLHEYALSDDLLAYTCVWRASDRPHLIVASKGAPEAIVDLCGLSPDERSVVLAQVERMAQRGLRVIAAARANWTGDAQALPSTPRQFGFSWCGLLGLADPLRRAVPGAVAEVRAAGVRVLMLTGDHRETASAIAAQAGLDGSAQVALGRELESLDDDALRQRVSEVNVFARVRPEHKLRLVNALKQVGDVVAMTGDGVNDAPALMASHVGIAMGGRGTDVARESAAIVLLDDNFVTIVGAIRLGRTIYDNIRRAVRYVLAVHVPITGLALLPLLMGGPLVLLPLHVVFLELIIDPACSIVFEREAPMSDVMRRPPRPTKERLVDSETLAGSLLQGLFMFAAVAALYLQGGQSGLPAPQLASVAFSAIVVGNLGLILLNRAGASIWKSLLQPNAAFWIVTLTALAMLFAVTRLMPTARWFRFEPAPWSWVALSLLLPILAVAVLDALRWLWRRHRQSRAGAPAEGTN